jgi:AhpD family alkylhydroperoxidase
MKSPALTLPGALEALQTLSKATEDRGVPRSTLELVHLRVGQLNGCAVCVDMHSRILKKLGESEARIWALAAWRESSYYSDAERAALTLAEAATSLSDRPDAVPDEVWKEASRHFDEPALGALIMTIAVANLWNRLNVTTRQVSGDWVGKQVDRLAGGG